MRVTGNRLGYRWWWVGLLSIGSLLPSLTGCQSMGGSVSAGSDEGAASAVRDPVLQDIPKPAGFVLDADRSVAIASGKFRLARCEYGGGLAPAAVKRFYEEYMPAANFELRRWSLDQGVYNLYFESSSEVCTIRTRPGDWRKTAVVVEIAPKPQGNTERESAPPMRRPQ
jgi:hypothetical protein